MTHEVRSENLATAVDLLRFHGSFRASDVAMELPRESESDVEEQLEALVSNGWLEQDGVYYSAGVPVETPREVC
ncbi:MULTISPECIES: hypothetical protein [Halorussus]|uniref:hypothetical protein n=1 Tax=Halorussus TaxID=1070314 RepID=UPI0020A17597|nr:hypothetical protein [Halorussus vallis]USZ74039.1 hypothetical protein NGM07_11285 [Halorussus vallis]